VPDSGGYRSDVGVRASEGANESRKLRERIEGCGAGSGRRGVRWSVSCCGDGDVVDVSESDGGGFEERGGKGKRWRLGCEFANESKTSVLGCCWVILHV